MVNNFINNVERNISKKNVFIYDFNFKWEFYLLL